jgi:hypothetical protein
LEITSTTPLGHEHLLANNTYWPTAPIGQQRATQTNGNHPGISLSPMTLCKAAAKMLANSAQ